LFILVLTGIQFEGEKIGQILRTASSTAASSSSASTLLNLDLRVQGRRIGKVLQCGALKVSCSFGFFLVQLFRRRSHLLGRLAEVIGNILHLLVVGELPRFK